jgi:hypothetical protein
MSPNYTGAVLLKCLGPLHAPEELPRVLKKLALDCVPLAESVAVHAAIEVDEGYAYLFSREPGAITAAVLARVAESAHSVPNFRGLQIGVARLQPVFDSPGASRGEAAPFHYIVETDVVPEHEADLNAWYDTEHMPGLAACPGCLRARRFRNPDGSPRYHACYDLVDPETLVSEAWLAMRRTAWSERVRPHFRNTKRTTFRRLFDVEL